jgi:hypothetical protein
MSGDPAPERRASADETDSPERHARVRVRLGYLLALVWVVVGSVLYLVEVVKLVIGHG